MITAAEQAIIEQTNAAIAAGEDPFGDNDGFETTTTTTTNNDQATADAAAAAAPAEAAKTNEGDPAGDNPDAGDTNVDAAALEAIANGDDTPALPAVADPLNFNVNAPEDYKTARSTLLAEKADAMAKLMNGEIDAAEYAQIETRVMDGLEDLSAQRIRAETLQELNTQSAAKTQTQVIQQLVASTAAQVPYATDAKAQRQFDMALQQVAADPDNAGKSFADLANEAHTVVLALRGIAKPKQKTPEELAAEAAAAAAARKPDGTPPVTLRSLPAASTANTGGDIIEQLSRLSGQEYEAAYNKLTPQQKAALLDD
jgi:hypothetical protein